MKKYLLLLPLLLLGCPNPSVQGNNTSANATLNVNLNVGSIPTPSVQVGG